MYGDEDTLPESSSHEDVEPSVWPIELDDEVIIQVPDPPPQQTSHTGHASDSSVYTNEPKPMQDEIGLPDNMHTLINNQAEQLESEQTSIKPPLCRSSRHHTVSLMEWNQVPLSWESHKPYNANLMLDTESSNIQNAHQSKSTVLQHALMAAQDIGEPTNLREAMASSESKD